MRGLDFGASSFWFMVLCASVAGVSGLMFGYDSGIITDTIAQTLFLDYFHNPSSAITGTIVAMLQAGAAVGAGIAAPINDGWGRKKSMMVGAACGVVGAALQAGAVSTAMLIVGRLVIGFSIGVLTMVVPVYQAEIAPPHARAFIMSIESIMTAIGYVIANWVGYGASFSTTSFQWRFPLSVQVLFALLVLCASPFLPESPRWLIEKGQDAKALKLTRRLHYTGDNDFVQREFQEMRDQILAEKETTVRSYKEALSKPSWRRRIFLACGVWIGVSLSGITVLNFYLSTFIKNLGYTTSQDLLLTGIYGFVGPISCLIAMCYLDRLPRVKMLWGGNIGMAIILACLTALTASSYNKTGHLSEQRAGIAMLFIYSFVYSATYGPISWIYPVEIFPITIRSIGFSISSVVNYAVMVMFSQVSPIGMENIQWKYYLFFVCSNLAMAVIVFFFYPETKGLSLEQIDEAFGDQIIPHALQDPKGANTLHLENAEPENF